MSKEESQPRKEDAVTQQIAREAAEKSATQLLNEDQWHDQSIAGVADELEPFILSAIKRATEGNKRNETQDERLERQFRELEHEPQPSKAPSERSEQWKQSVEDRLDRIERRLQNVPHY